MNYQLFIIPILVMLIAQISKAVFARGPWNWRRFSKLNDYGGMPSSHAAMVTSLVAVIAYYEGLNSPAFAVALITALIIIRDASGFRQQVSRHSKIINKLVKELPDEEEYKFPVLKEIFGHKATEVLAGIIFGLVVTAILIQFWS